MAKDEPSSGPVAPDANQSARARNGGARGVLPGRGMPYWTRAEPNGGQDPVGNGSLPPALLKRLPRWKVHSTDGAHKGLQRDLLIRHSILPIRRENGTVDLAVGDRMSAAPAKEIALSRGLEARIFLADPEAIRRQLAILYRAEDQREVAWGHAWRRPDLSAERVLTGSQQVVGALLLALLAAALFFSPSRTVVGLVGVCTLIYLTSTLYKLAVVAAALARPGELAFSDEEVGQLEEETLPSYTILLPLFREANVVERLLQSVGRLDYPKSKLDVKLLLEADDEETRQAIEEAPLPPEYECLVVPAAGPRGKPKALNYGLRYARGEYCVIYDAEDRPEPDQLKKAALAFQRATGRVGCIQAKLNFYNPSQNLLTSWFTIEYSQWFELYLSGLMVLGAPITLGGTSNHFPTEVLRRLAGWDPFNVTEDADLGLRLARAGWKTVMVDSVTYEEANSRLGNWLRQRSHWTKGYMQTWLVHMRNPFRLWRELGAHGFVSVQMTVGATVFGYFANPVFWLLLALWYGAGLGAIQSIYPAPLLYAATLLLFGANAVYIYVSLMGCIKHGFYAGARYVLLIPFYWALMSLAAFHALYQLVRKPHYWEKTVHGLTAATG